ncbi:MAG TPA: aminodeoxychorismate synthase, component I, partial [Halothiobacillaceae bacterium]|nr:aminodeoxychorismate synthase, component I [Halothiobacillaceae bacterium]
AGDVFQANLSHAWRFRLASGVSSAAVYDALCRRNPAPFAAWYRQPEGEIVSSSPERLLRVADGLAETRPIAGTRRRDPDPERDRELIEQLQAHPKERAEHVMLIDLERNDLGRVCEPGSVRVDELMVVESYAQVHHLVSNVVGRLSAASSPLAALAACFPGGTITGCPKVRCMEILAELEQAGRGPYTGSLGYLSNHGRMDSNILIRSLFLAPDGQGEFRTGGGIVADSDPARELDETYQKARGVLDALGGETALAAGVPSE